MDNYFFASSLVFVTYTTGNKQLQHSLLQKTGNGNKLLTEDLQTEEGER
jgi:hypothetical protein